MKIGTDINIKDILTLTAFCFVIGLSYADRIAKTHESSQLEKLVKEYYELERRVDRVVSSDGEEVPSKTSHEARIEIELIKMRVRNLEKKLNERTQEGHIIQAR